MALEAHLIRARPAELFQARSKLEKFDIDANTASKESDQILQELKQIREENKLLNQALSDHGGFICWLKETFGYSQKQDRILLIKREVSNLLIELNKEINEINEYVSDIAKPLQEKRIILTTRIENVCSTTLPSRQAIQDVKDAYSDLENSIYELQEDPPLTHIPNCDKEFYQRKIQECCNNTLNVLIQLKNELKFIFKRDSDEIIKTQHNKLLNLLNEKFENFKISLNHIHKERKKNNVIKEEELNELTFLFNELKRFIVTQKDKNPIFFEEKCKYIYHNLDSYENKIKEIKLFNTLDERSLRLEEQLEIVLPMIKDTEFSYEKSTEAEKINEALKNGTLFDTRAFYTNYQRAFAFVEGLFTQIYSAPTGKYPTLDILEKLENFDAGINKHNEFWSILNAIDRKIFRKNYEEKFSLGINFSREYEASMKKSS